MSGHSKWSTIKHKKAKEDAKRGQTFTKLIKEITTAAKLGGGDLNANSRLRLLVDKAKSVNMPMENTQRAIKRGTGELPGVSYEAITYEGYGPYGIAVIVEVLTDNKNRAVSELRRFFSSNGGNLAENGSVSWMFKRSVVIKAAGNTTDEQLFDLLMNYDFDDVVIEDGIISVICEPKGSEKVKQVLIDNGLKVESAELEYVPKSATALDESKEEKALSFLSELEDLEDVQNVYTNLA